MTLDAIGGCVPKGCVRPVAIENVVVVRVRGWVVPPLP